MGLEKVSNFAELAIDRLLQQDKERKTIDKLVTSFVSEVQNVENSMFDVYKDRGIYSAIGAQLDVIGIIVGETRNGRADDAYRIAILARIKLNVSAGEPNSIIDAIIQLMNPTVVDFSEPYPAYFTLFVQSSINIPNIASIVKEISPAGVGSSIATLPSGFRPFVFATTTGEPGTLQVQSGGVADFEVQSPIGVISTLDVVAQSVLNVSNGDGFATVYLTNSILELNDGSTLILNDGSELDLKLINANESYTISDFGGKWATVRT